MGRDAKESEMEKSGRLHLEAAVGRMAAHDPKKTLPHECFPVDQLSDYPSAGSGGLLHVK